jgi:hypothetical protein
MRFLTLLAFRLEARGVEPFFPACYVRQRPRLVYRAISEANTFSCISVNLCEFFLLLSGGKGLETSRIAVLDHSRVLTSKALRRNKTVTQLGGSVLSRARRLQKGGNPTLKGKRRHRSPY